MVLKGGTAAEVWQWLADAGYYQDPLAEPIVQAYLDAGYYFYFAAARLIHGAGVDELQPSDDLRRHDPVRGPCG